MNLSSSKCLNLSLKTLYNSRRDVSDRHCNTRDRPQEKQIMWRCRSTRTGSGRSVLSASVSNSVCFNLVSPEQLEIKSDRMCSKPNKRLRETVRCDVTVGAFMGPIRWNGVRVQNDCRVRERRVTSVLWSSGELTRSQTCSAVKETHECWILFELCCVVNSQTSYHVPR